MAVISVWLRVRWPLRSIFTPVICMYLGAERDERCQPLLLFWYPINPGLTCSVLSGRTRKQRSVWITASNRRRAITSWWNTGSCQILTCSIYGCFSATVLHLQNWDYLENWFDQTWSQGERQWLKWFLFSPESEMINSLQKGLFEYPRIQVRKTTPFKHWHKKIHVYAWIMQQLSPCIGKP